MLSDPKSKANLIITVITVVLGVAVDQFTKFLALTYLTYGNAIEIIPYILNLNIVRNRGSAFGMGQNWPPIFQKTVLLVLPVLAIIIISIILIKNIKSHRLMIVGFSLILGGAIGNVYDRIMNSYVVDFIELHFKQYHWPNFNFADTIICVGVGLYVIYSFKASKKYKTIE